MAEIKLPSDVLQKESFKSLPAKEKDEYISNLLKKVLELNPEGITISQINEAAELTYSTIWHHLEFLNSTAQCRKISRGNLDVYYPSGNSSHLNEYTSGKIKYSVGTLNNSDGDFVSIHEKKENRMGNYAICRGVNMPHGLIGEIIETLKKTDHSQPKDKEIIKSPKSKIKSK